MTWENARALLSLLCSVVALLAQALKIPSIEEQNLITLVRLDVVNGVSCLDRAQRPTQAACWLGLKLMPSQPIPALRLI